jgi:hypothetical protein
MSKAVYIGAGLDITPVIQNNEILDWILVDSQPSSEFGIERKKGFSRPNFVPNLKDIMMKKDFICQSDNNNLLIFENLDSCQRIRYYINTAIPEEFEKNKDSTNNWDTLVVIGFWPHKIIMSNSSQNLTFIGNKSSSYLYEGLEDEKDTVIEEIFLNKIKFQNYKIFNNKKFYNFKRFEKIN